MSETPNLIFGINPMLFASSILLISYFLLFTEKLNRAVVALLGACIMVISGVLSQNEAFKGIDFNTLALLIGMMIIVGVAAKSGMFQYVAIWSAKKVNASPRGLLIVLTLVTAVFSAFLDNVTTVLLIVPVTLQITKKLKLNPYPYLILNVFASNIGGTATLIGDPPNIMLGSALNLSFMDFVYNLAPVIIVIMLVLVAAFDFIIGRKLQATSQNRALVMKMNENETITNKSLLIKSLTVLFLVIVGFISAEHIKVANGTIAMFGAAVLLMLYTYGDKQPNLGREHQVNKLLTLVDWTTIFFFSGLFVIVHGLEVTGLLHMLGEEFISLTDGSIEKATYLIVWISAILSSAIDNIPFVATMIPMIKSMEPSMGGREAMMPVWWGLSLGACLGGNGTIIGASANVIVAGIATRENHPISFLGFMLWAMPTMLVSVAISTVYLYLRYFA